MYATLGYSKLAAYFSGFRFDDPCFEDSAYDEPYLVQKCGYEESVADDYGIVPEQFNFAYVGSVGHDELLADDSGIYSPERFTATPVYVDDYSHLYATMDPIDDLEEYLNYEFGEYDRFYGEAFSDLANKAIGNTDTGATFISDVFLEFTKLADL